jgi:DnaK suppressor protein
VSSGAQGVEPSAPPEETSGPSPADDARRLEEISAELAGVEASLKRLDDGTYGTCEVCGIPIEAAALEADPLHSRCPDHPR